jgi:hypothetical protein
MSTDLGSLGSKVRTLDESDDDSGDELSSLFRVVAKSEAVFYFERIAVTHDVPDNSRVSFEYSYNKKLTIVSSMVVGGGVDIDRHRNLLLSIGMCILPWYWMGFAASR